MGCEKNISYDTFPKQSDWVGKLVKACFHYDTSKNIMGRIIRDDIEEPGVGIIQLFDGRVILMTECQYSNIKD